MNDGEFTPRAAVLWATIPKEARERILANVFCFKCRDSVTITNFTGEERKGDVYLKGSCAKRGHEVVRVVETSERDMSGNSSGTSCLRRDRSNSIGEIARILQNSYEDFAHHNRKNPFEELLFILCSVQTDEKKYRYTFQALRRAFPRFEDLAKARAREIARPLKPGGLSATKSRMIQGLCRTIARRFGRITLAPLKRMSDTECEAVLTSLPGVGLKVARCVMMYSLGRDVFPVDAHCWRVSRRLGWIRSASKDGVCSRPDMERLQEMIPSKLRFSLHVNLISLGREFCTAKSPRCCNCPVAGLCEWQQRRRDHTG